MTPIPVMMMPNGILEMSRPQSAPMVDRITLDMMISTMTSELNWLTRIMAMAKSATIRAFVKKAAALCCSSSCPR